jgi:hypothetical protein
VSFIWATRGRSWGFRFLRTAGISDPLLDYEAAFAGIEDAPQAWRRDANRVALRFPDPLGRQDRAGRVISHQFVVFEPLADEVHSVEDGLREVWPLVASRFAQVWDKPDPPTVDG